MSYAMPFGEDEDKITAMAARLRKLHTEGRSGTASFSRTVGLVRSHVTPDRNSSAKWLETVLDHHETQAELATKGALIGLVVERQGPDGETVSEEISPEQIFWDWLYGVYLHDDEDRLERVEAWQSIGAHKFNFLKTASDLAKVYYAFFGIVRDVLAEPELCPPTT